MIHREDITSFADHHAHLKDHFRQVNATGRPMFVTTNGQTEAVILSPDAYEKLAEDAEITRSVKMIDQGMQDIKAGRTQPAKEAIEAIAAEYGITLEQKPAQP